MLIPNTGHCRWLYRPSRNHKHTHGPTANKAIAAHVDHHIPKKLPKDNPANYNTTKKPPPHTRT
jgi:hypothetical protein